ncbi:hypothetical protein Cgig2_010372 [Carnegiea gigantea]|uniref:Uncharacterized protein n=1 Tax=Carnegiea gigantea TaxID=171969 RepID=A0A9Q1K613_9CARY|nr:hypothetical protein Cgig2_010372 [Carnegiea gigantea]
MLMLLRHSTYAVLAFWYLLLLFFSTTFFNASSACSNGNCQLLESCSANTDCAPGLYCGNCPAASRPQPVCTRGQANIPTSIISGLPFNRYSWLVTHNAFSNVNAPPLPGVQRVTFYNQEDTVTNQLRLCDDFFYDRCLEWSERIDAGHVRLSERYLALSFFPGPLLQHHRFQIVTIIIEDYVHTPKGLTRLFANAGLDKYWYPVSKMPKKGEDWPTVNDMVQQITGLVFTSVASRRNPKELLIMRYMVENEHLVVFLEIQENKD